MIDKKTDHLALPLPNEENSLSVDCGRIATALTAIDTAVHGLDTTRATKTALAAVEAAKAPVSHASENQNYGVGTASSYGHVRLSSLPDSLLGESSGVAATPAAVQDVQDSVDDTFALLSAALSPTWYQRAGLMTVTRTTVTVPAGTVVAIGDGIYKNVSAVTIDLDSASSWDSPTYATPSSRAGLDAYVYACVGVGNHVPRYVLSANSTVPTGYSAADSRKIGGFHCLCLAVGSVSGHVLSGYATGDIIPRSVWDLRHRPVADPEGMVFVNGLWVDIYLASWNGSKFVSQFGAAIADGESAKKFNGEMFAEYAGLSSKRFVRRDEFVVFAKGSNEGTNIAGSADPGTTGGHKDTAGRRMVSDYGIEDCCGVLWQWSADCYESWALKGFNSAANNAVLWDNSPTWYSVNKYLTGYQWREEPVYNAYYDSQKRGSCYGLLRRARLGACWGDGSHCGSRAVLCSVLSASGWPFNTVRLASEPRVTNL